jgi:ribose 5-phosphate isomerase B
MKIIIGSDHGGFELKEQVKEYLNSEEIVDLGTHDKESCDYPEIAANVAEEVLKENSKGILVCGTGIGMCITANKFKGIRAALCYDEYTAKMAREHNDANIICLGGRTTDIDKIKKILDIFLKTDKSAEDRHKRRVSKIIDIEKNNFK